MYVSINIVDHTLGEVRLSPTLEEAVEKAIQITNSWPPIVSNFDINDVREQLTITHEYHACNLNNGLLYSIYIGLT